MPGQSFEGGTKSMAFVRGLLVKHEKLWHGRECPFLLSACFVAHRASGDFQWETGKKTVLKNWSHGMSQGKRVIIHTMSVEGWMGGYG